VYYKVDYLIIHEAPYVLIGKSGFAKNLETEDMLCFAMDDIVKMIGGSGKR
jgi:hypothetical protein